MLHWVQLVVPAWGAGVLFIMFRKARTWCRLFQIRRRSTCRVPPWLREIFEKIRDRMNVAQTVGLRISAELASPIAIGVVKPLVIMPLSVITGMPSQQLETLIAHELAHIRRYDTAVNWLQC